MSEEKDKFTSAMLHQIRSNEDIVLQLDEVLKIARENQIEYESADLERKGLRKSLDMVYRFRSKEEKLLSDALTASQSEVERLNEWIDYHKDADLRIMNLLHITDYTAVEYAIIKLIESAQSRESEANSCREQYDELREALVANISYSHKGVLTKIERMKKKVANSEHAYAKASKANSEKLKLISLIKKHIRPRREGHLDPKKLMAEYKAW
jgi:hypothetical protein